MPLVDGRAEAVADLCKAALASMPNRAALRRVAGSGAPALTEGFLTQAILKQAARDPGRVAAGALQINPARQSFLLWRWS